MVWVAASAIKSYDQAHSQEHIATGTGEMIRDRQCTGLVAPHNAPCGSATRPVVLRTVYRYFRYRT